MPVGQPIGKKVVNQLHARETILSKKDRTPSDLAWMNSRNVFVRLMSSVNTLTDAEAKRIYESHDITAAKGDSTLAKSNVLYSLGLASDASRNDFTQKVNIKTPGVVTDFDRNTSLGIRPKPGITNFTVKSKNTYGTLREAEVSIKVWSVSDLELIDKLYFRPGYTVLLEWGHTHYYLSDKNTYNAEILTVTDFFNSGNSFEDVEEKIDKLRIKSDYNYDGMMGYCSNFSWSLNADGSYDATVKIISRGAIIESLKSNTDPLSHIDPKYLEDTDDEEGKKQRKSIFHFILNAMEKHQTENLLINRDELIKEIPDLDALLPPKEVLGVRANCDLADTGWIFEDSVNLQWITLGTLCHIVNTAVMPHSGDGRKQAQMNVLYDEERIALAIADNKPAETVVRTNYVTHPAHFSIDPYVCFLPVIPANEEIAKEAVVDLYDAGLGEAVVDTVVDAAIDLWDWVTGNNTVNLKGAQPKMIDILKTQRGNRFKKYGVSSTIPNNTLDICVSSYFLYEVLDSIYDQEEGDKSLFTIFRKILDGINDALGGINELDLYFNEEDNKYYIIDRKNTTPNQEPPTFKVTGLGSSVMDLQISTKISNEMASMISIASQSTRPDSQEDIDALMTWNRGKIDRLMPSKVVESPKKVAAKKADNTKSKKEDFDNWMDDLDDTFGHFCNRWGRNQKYRKSDHEALKSYHKLFNSEALQLSQKAAGNPPTGVIPLELSLKMEGIAGLKVAEAFNIDGAAILPDKYKEFSYIITGLDHTIENNRWVTNIKTQFYISQKPSSSEKSAAQASQKAYQQVTREARENSNNNSGSGSGGSMVTVTGPTLKGDDISYDDLKAVVLTPGGGGTWFNTPYMLNIVGIRNMAKAVEADTGRKLGVTNKFDDLICVAWTDNNGTKYAESYPVSTDPGLSALANPLDDAKKAGGTAILKEGFYKDAWKIGYHKYDPTYKYRHAALVQTGNVTVYRDGNRDSFYNLDERNIQTGSWFGVNMHRGSYGAEGVNVGGFSHGCQVWKVQSQHTRFMSLCKQQVDEAKHDRFSYYLTNTDNANVKKMNLL